MISKTHEYLTRQYMLKSDYEIFHYSNTDLDSISLHHHDFYECYLFISGDVTYLIEGKTYYLEPGDIILINSKELHQAVINGKEPVYERIVLWISKAFLEKLSTEETGLSLCFEGSNRRNVIRGDIELKNSIKTLLSKLLCLEYYKGIGKELLYKAYITEIIVYLNNLTFNEMMHSDTDLKKGNLIDSMIAYISNHLEEDISIDKLSEHFYLSKFHLSREFKKHTGTTIHKYIVQKKLIEAKELIIKGIPIIDVYKQCGFGEYSNFFRVFKNVYGVTPKQFYKAMANLN